MSPVNKQKRQCGSLTLVIYLLLLFFYSVFYKAWDFFCQLRDKSFLFLKKKPNASPFTFLFFLGFIYRLRYLLGKSHTNNSVFIDDHDFGKVFWLVELAACGASRKIVSHGLFSHPPSPSCFQFKKSIAFEKHICFVTWQFRHGCVSCLCKKPTTEKPSVATNRILRPLWLRILVGLLTGSTWRARHQ